ncbi:hypothetical protein F5Y06DRAFT_83926 [Hypoxylon sp. FL0890]|nr:hypothetical protein F5Y06DRAFT_83926 [Hypoxylon sp. FL0890]
MKQATFDQCPCTRREVDKHHDPVQALFPLKLMQNLKKKPQTKLKSQGAVIFGHNMNLHWYREDSGNPIRGDPPPDPGSVTNTFNDSGLGSSLDLSNSHSVCDSSRAATTPGDALPAAKPMSPPRVPQENVLRSLKRRLLDMGLSISKRGKIVVTLDYRHSRTGFSSIGDFQVHKTK